MIAAFLKRNPLLAAAFLFCFLAGMCLLFGTGCVPSIYLTPDHITVDHGQGNTVQFQAKDGTGNTIQGVTWSCDPSVGTITASGLLTATGWGTCNVTASKSGYQNGSAKVQVPTYLSGTLSTSQTLTKQYNPYILSGTVVVPAGKTLTINPGTVVKAKPGATLQVEGTLTSVGTTGEPITFTSFKDDSVWGDTNDDGTATSPARGDWSKIYIRANAQPSRVEFTNSSYAQNAVSIDGGSHKIKNCQVKEMSSDGISVGGGVQNITNNTINNCAGFAMSLGSFSPNNVRNNTGSGSGTNGILVSGTYNANCTWNATNPHLPYIILNSCSTPPLTVAQGKTLTIEPGVVVKAQMYESPDFIAFINVQGKLLSQGTAANPVTFTSIRDDIGGNTDNSSDQPARGDWGGIDLQSGTEVSQLSYTNISYGGGNGANYRPGLWIEAGSHRVSHCRLSYMDAWGGALTVSGGNPQIKDDTEISDSIAASSFGTVRLDGGSPTLSNCRLLRDYAIKISGGSPTISGCHIQDALVNGIEVSGGTPTITANIIDNCASYAIWLGCFSPNNVRNNAGNGTNGIGVGGTYQQDVTWNATNSHLPYIIPNSCSTPPLTVAQGKTLTIEPGVVVKGQMYESPDFIAFINVQGKLLSRGTAANPVTFTSIRDDIGGNTDNSSDQPARGDWGGIDLQSGTEVSEFTYTNISYGGGNGANYRPGLWIEAGSHRVSHCRLSYMLGRGGALTVSGGNPQIKDDTEISNSTAYWGLGTVRLDGGSPTLSNCRLLDSGSGDSMIKISGGTPTVSGCHIQDIAGDGIAVSAGTPTITGNTIERCSNTGIITSSVGNSIIDNNITACKTGIYCTGNANGTISKNIITGSIDAGIVVKNSIPAAVTDNYVDGGGTCPKGIQIERFFGDVARNTFTNCHTGMYVYGTVAAETPNIHNNYIGQNSDWGIDNYGPNVLANSDNNWGDPTGPSPPGAGSGRNPDKVVETSFKGIKYPWQSSGMAGIGINTSHGSFEYQTKDLELPGRGIPIGITRTYNSAGPTRDSPLGCGWSFNYDTSLEDERYYTGHGWATTDVTLVESGSEIIYTPQGGGFIPQKGCFDSLVRESDTTFLLTQKDHTKLRFTKAASQPSPNIIRYLLTQIIDQNGNITLLTYLNDQLDRVYDPSLRYLRFTWGGNHITRIEDSTGTPGRKLDFQYDANGDLVFFADPNNNATSYEYGPAHYLMKIVEPGGDKLLENHYYQTFFNPNGYMRVEWQKDGQDFQTYFSYDIAASKTTIWEPGRPTKPRYHYYDGGYHLTHDISPEENTTIYTYDADGNVTQVVDPESNTSLFAYDDRGNLLAATDAEGRATHYTYENDNLKTTKDPDGKTTTNNYDANNNLTKTDYPDPKGHVDYTYHPSGKGLGEVYAQIDSQGHTKTYEYDQQGNLSDAEMPMGTYNRHTEYSYDLKGLLSVVTDPQNHLTGYSYDASGNLTHIMDHLHYEDPGGHHLVDYAYWPDNNLRSFTDKNSNTTTYTQDHNNQLIEVKDPALNLTTYTYDCNHNLSSIKDARQSNTNTNFVYDNDNRLVEMDDHSGDTHQYLFYFKNGLVKCVQRPGLSQINYTYYPDNLVHTISSQYSPQISYTFEYTPVNQISQVTDSSGDLTNSFYYYVDSELLSETHDYHNPSINDGFTTNYTYDDLSQLTSLSCPDISPDLLQVMNYNNAGELARIQLHDVGEVYLDYFADGNPLFIFTPDGSHRWFHYDNADRIDEVQNQTPSGTKTITYSHDNNGNIRTINGAETYRYDSLNRLVWWRNPDDGVITEYSYDPVGNLTEVRQNGTPVKTFSYNCANEISNAGFTYDTNGNLTSDGAKDCTYDAFNRLIEVKNHATQQTIAVYTYDFAGRRTSKTKNGTTTYYHWDKDSNLLAETDSSGNLKATYTYDDKGNPLAMRRGGAPYYYQTNSHGDIISLTNSSGQIVNTYTYDPWGKLLTENETVENPFRFQGSVYDSETGLYYLMSRYYDPNTYRFLSRDALDLSNMANPLQLNQYAYCVGNSVTLIDKDGRRTLVAPMKNALKRLVQKIMDAVNRVITEINKARITLLVRNKYVNLTRLYKKGQGEQHVSGTRIEETYKPIVVKTLYVGGGVEIAGGMILIATGNPFGMAAGESLVTTGFSNIMEGSDIKNDVVDEPFEYYPISFPYGFHQ